MKIKKNIIQAIRVELKQSLSFYYFFLIVYEMITYLVANTKNVKSISKIDRYFMGYEVLLRLRRSDWPDRVYAEFAVFSSLWMHVYWYSVDLTRMCKLHAIPLSILAENCLFSFPTRKSSTKFSEERERTNGTCRFDILRLQFLYYYTYSILLFCEFFLSALSV